MTNYAHGREAEQSARQYLEKHGYKILATNWRTRYCEIDIIASKNRTAYCVEVKYRENTNQGYGLDYITPKKLQQMHFAAEMWASDNRWDREITLAAMEISGPSYTVTAWLDSI